MTRIVAVANQKGGVGKTTTSISLASDIAAHGLACLLVDLDPQANATSGLGVSADELNMYDVLIEDRPLADVVMDLGGGLFLAPSNADLAGAEVELVPAMAREFRLKRALEPLAGIYDFVIVDCPPSLGLMTLNALTAADEALVPVQCEYLALEGLSQLTRTLDAVRRNLNPGLRLAGLLLTMYDGRTNLGQQVADEVRRHFRETFTTVIPRNVRVSEAPSHGLPVGRYAPSSPAAKAYKAFAAEFLAGRVGNSPSELRELQPEPVERGRPGGEVHRAGAKA
jgi:chromosome partitioning protein